MFLILTRIKRDIIISVHTSLCKVPAILQDFNETLIFSTDFRKILRYQISQISVQWEPSCTTRTDGLTDVAKLIVVLCSFANPPKNYEVHCCKSTSSKHESLHFCK